MQIHYLLITMICLQILWLSTIWLTGASDNWRKIALLFAYTIVLGGTIIFIPSPLMFWVREQREYIIRNEKILVSILSLTVFIAGIIYANCQQVWPDEAHNFEAAKIVAEEGVGSFFFNYSGIPWLGIQHPPLVPVIYGYIMRLLGTNLFVIRLFSLFIGIVTIVITYFIGKALYDRNTGFFAAIILLCFPLFFRSFTVALMDIPVTFFFSLTLLVTIYLIRKPTYRLSFSAGILISAGIFSKYTMLFIYPVLFSYFLLNSPSNRARLHLGIVTLVSVCTMAIWLIYACHIDVLALQWQKIVHYARIATTTHYGKKLMFEALLTSLPSSLGVYNMPILFLGLLRLMQRRNQSDLFIFLWVAAVFLPWILTLPVTRYFMPAFPGMAIIMSLGLVRFFPSGEKVIIMALSNCGGALYLYADWHRKAYMFIH